MDYKTEIVEMVDCTTSEHVLHLVHTLLRLMNSEPMIDEVIEEWLSAFVDFS